MINASGRIDAHIDWVVLPAVKDEEKGVGVFYIDKEKAGKYSALSAIADKARNQQGSISSGLVHNIDDNGSPVKDF